MKVFISILFTEECDWERVIKVVDKFKGANHFEYTHGVFYSGEYTYGEGLLFELSKLGYPMHIMRNVE
jgi:hypothetical protein